MLTRTQLDIRGISGRVVPNTLYQYRPGAPHLLLLFPGWCYTADAPLFYYTRKLAEQIGADALAIDYGYHRLEGFAELPADESDRGFRAEVHAAFAAVDSRYERYTLVGKSIGTQAVAELLATEPLLARADAVLLTPTFSQDHFREQLEALTNDCLTIIGSSDAEYQPQYLDLAHELGELMVIDGADHSLEFPGELDRSIEALVSVSARMRRFLSRPKST